jgi:hypothetical protein
MRRLPASRSAWLLVALLFALAAAGLLAFSEFKQRRDRTTGQIRSITDVGSAVELELTAKTTPYIGALVNWLCVGDLYLERWEAPLPTYRDGSYRFFARLTPEQFAAVPDGAPVGFYYGIPRQHPCSATGPEQGARADISFGRLGKRRLVAGPSRRPPTPIPAPTSCTTASPGYRIATMVTVPPATLGAPTTIRLTLHTPDRPLAPDETVWVTIPGSRYYAGGRWQRGRIVVDLSPAAFAALPDGAPLTVRYGDQRPRCFGPLDKRLLDAR